MAAKSKIKIETIDDYLATANPEQRAALQKLRETIHAIVPKVEERINYGIAAFFLDGKPVAGLGAGAKHCTYFPMSGSTLATLKDHLKGYVTSKGAIRFPAEQPLPKALVRKLLKARIAEKEKRDKKAK